MAKTTLLLVALGAMFACPQPSPPASCSCERHSDRLVIECRRDSDCAAGAFCVCGDDTNCSILARFSTVAGDPTFTCVSEKDRLSAWVPIRSDGGWVVESDPRHRHFRSHDEAMNGFEDGIP